MNSSQLQAFLTVVRFKSFNKASRALYITPAATMKKIDSLEAELGVRLFERFHTGVVLTDAGTKMVPEAENILAVIDQAKRVVTPLKNQVIRIGTSVINPATQFAHLWRELETKIPNYQFVYVPVNEGTTDRPYSELGKSIDIMVGPFNLVNRHDLLARTIRNAHFTISMLSSNPLRTKKIITFADLVGMNFFAVPAKISANIDCLRQEMVKSGIKIQRTDSEYSLNTFNRLRTSKDCLLSLDFWKEVRPDIISIPLATEITLPIAAIINCNAPKYVKDIYNNIGKR